MTFVPKTQQPPVTKTLPKSPTGLSTAKSPATESSGSGTARPHALSTTPAVETKSLTTPVQIQNPSVSTTFLPPSATIITTVITVLGQKPSTIIETFVPTIYSSLMTLKSRLTTSTVISLGPGKSTTIPFIIGPGGIAWQSPVSAPPIAPPTVLPWLPPPSKTGPRTIVTAGPASLGGISTGSTHSLSIEPNTKSSFPTVGGIGTQTIPSGSLGQQTEPTLHNTKTGIKILNNSSPTLLPVGGKSTKTNPITATASPNRPSSPTHSKTSDGTSNRILTKTRGATVSGQKTASLPGNQDTHSPVSTLSRPTAISLGRIGSTTTTGTTSSTSTIVGITASDGKSTTSKFFQVNRWQLPI